LLDCENTPLDGLVDSADPNVRRAFEELKLQTTTDTKLFLRNILTLGKFIRNVGIRDLIRGANVMVQARMFENINVLEEHLQFYKGKNTEEAMKERIRIMDGIARQGQVILYAQKALLETEGRLAGNLNPDPPTPIRDSFKPGQQVIPMVAETVAAPAAAPAPETIALPAQPIGVKQ
jgi:hypothetical protein